MTVIYLLIKVLGALAGVALLLRSVERTTHRLLLHLEQFGKTGDPANIAAAKLDLERRRVELEAEFAKTQRIREELAMKQAAEMVEAARNQYDG